MDTINPAKGRSAANFDFFDTGRFLPDNFFRFVMRPHAGNAAANNNQSGIEVVRLTENHEIEELVRFFEAVSEEQGWQPGAALRDFRPQSVYFALNRADGESFIGGLQLVLPDAGGRLPCQTVWPDVQGTLQRSAHIAILAVEAAYRGTPLLFWHLAVEMWRYGVGHGLTTLFIEVTPRVLPLYRRLGWPLHIVGERRIHWGEACYLCTLGLPDVARVLLEKAEHSAYYRQIVAQAFRVRIWSGQCELVTASNVELAA